jgi:hypothetical protein
MQIHHQDYASQLIPFCPVCMDSWHSNNEGKFFCPTSRSDCPLGVCSDEFIPVEISGLTEVITYTNTPKKSRRLT